MKSRQFKNILVCEDDPVLLDELREIFEIEFENVVIAVDGAEAYIQTRNQEFDLIFTDIRMPGMSGIELVARLRSEGKMVPVILCSSSAENHQLVQGIRLGIHDFLEKPFTPDTLRETLFRVLEIVRREKALAHIAMENSDNSFEVQKHQKVLGLLQAVGSTKKAL